MTSNRSLDSVQNRSAIAGRLRTKSSPVVLFFIGSSPSLASKIISPDYPAAGVMVSVNSLRSRVSDFEVGDWIIRLDYRFWRIYLMAITVIP